MTISTGREFEGKALFNAYMDSRGRDCDCGCSFLLGYQTNNLRNRLNRVKRNFYGLKLHGSSSFPHSSSNRSSSSFTPMSWVSWNLRASASIHSVPAITDELNTRAIASS